jgi:hypothetical protein
LSEPDRDGAFEGIEKYCNDIKGFASRPGYIGGTGCMIAECPYILVKENLSYPIGKRE